MGCVYLGNVIKESDMGQELNEKCLKCNFFSRSHLGIQNRIWSSDRENCTSTLSELPYENRDYPYFESRELFIYERTHILSYIWECILLSSHILKWLLVTDLGAYGKISLGTVREKSHQQYGSSATQQVCLIYILFLQGWKLLSLWLM